MANKYLLHEISSKISISFIILKDQSAQEMTAWYWWGREEGVTKESSPFLSREDAMSDLSLLISAIIRNCSGGAYEYLVTSSLSENRWLVSKRLMNSITSIETEVALFSVGNK